MRALLFVLLICSVWTSMHMGSGSLYGQAGNNPFEPLLRDFSQKSGKLMEEIDEKILPIRKKFVAAVVTQAQKLSKNEEEEPLRDLNNYLTNVEAAPNVIKALDAITAELPPLHTGVHGSIAVFLEEVNQVDKEYAPKLERLKVAVLRSIKQQAAKGKRAGQNLDSKTEKFLKDLLALPNPKFDRVVPQLPENDEEAELVWKRTGIEFNLALDRDILQQTNVLFADLYQLRDAAFTNNNDLMLKQLSRVDAAFRAKKPSVEEAFAIKRNRDPSEFDGTLEWRNPSLWITANQDDLMDPIEVVLVKHANKCKEIKDSYAEAFAKLDKAWAGRNSKELKKLLLSDAPLEKKVSETRSHMRLIREDYEWLTMSHNYPLPGVEPEVMAMLDELTKSGRELVLAADKNDAELRNILIAKLKEIQNADAVEESGLQDLLASLTSDYGEGIRGTLVFDVDPRLGAEAKKLTEQYLVKAEQLREKVFSTYTPKVSELRSKLKAKRSALIQKDDFLGALLLDLHLAQRTYPIPPIWVRYNQNILKTSIQNDYERSFPVQLLARDSQKGFLILNAGKPIDWQARERISLSYNEYTKSEAEIGEKIIWINKYEFNPKHPSSKPLEVGMRLKPGDQLLVPKGREWVERRVKELSPFGVVVEMSNARTEPLIDIIPRGIVRWINEQKVE